MRSMLLFSWILCLPALLWGQKTFPGNQGYIAATKGVPMRSSPDVKGAKIATIAKGESVLILSEPLAAFETEGVKGHWRQIEYKGQKGYAFDGFISRFQVETGQDNEPILRETYPCKNDEGCDSTRALYADGRIVESIATDYCDSWSYTYFPQATIEEAFIWLRSYDYSAQEFTLKSPNKTKIDDGYSEEFKTNLYTVWECEKDEKGAFKTIHISDFTRDIHIYYSKDRTFAVVYITEVCL